ncbi:hydrogenase formation protein HypD [Paraferrimonas sedimenticola]|uniref:Hydrogenase maturation factor n=1 Tax=Paraferrimonas sedimenticola TaxID=375674 RepID=A0AA37W238_9GAMM|nr:hydrogenase formation protein HypD [Paraferrimonas sedimenticola]GLP97302.1 hydrogenase expression/formation protein [Paraferrimonas sedimenticola]
MTESKPIEMSLDALYSGFRDPSTIASMIAKINQKAEQLTQPMRVMEVCGGHTHSIMKYGLPQALSNKIQFVHGPGCPVCVMPKERIDHAIALAQQENVILATLGDMIRVPGSRMSLAQARAQGAEVHALYDPMHVIELARDNPHKRVVYFAIGFETTTPMTAVVIEQAIALKLDNLLFHVNHVLVPPAMDAVMADGQANINAFIGPSHVSVVTGAKIYRPAVEQYKTPLVVAGFEPVDVLESLLMLVEQQLDGRAELEIQYRRAVTNEGNTRAQELIDTYLEPRSEFRWRGLGDIPHSALKLRAEWQHLDAENVFAEVLPQTPIDDHKACLCGKILKGLAGPKDCKVFGRGCDPQRPMGSCMVSSEGACNAYYRYGRISEEIAQ